MSKKKKCNAECGKELGGIKSVAFLSKEEAFDIKQKYKTYPFPKQEGEKLQGFTVTLDWNDTESRRKFNEMFGHYDD